MSGTEDYDFDDNDSNGPAQLRKAYNAMKKQLDEANAQIQQLSAVKRSVDASQVLTKLGANPKLARLLPADVEVSEDSVKSWLEDFGDVFGLKPTPPAEAPAESEVEPAQPDTLGVSPDFAAAFQRATAIESNSAPAVPGVIDAIASAANQDLSFSDVTKLLHGLAGKS